MLTKLAIFGVGYLLGTRAGRQRYEAIMAEARDILTGPEVSTAVGFIRGALWILSQRGRAAGRRIPYVSPERD